MKNLKLTERQLKCIEEMKNKIDAARKYNSFEEWLLNTNSYLMSRDNPKEHLESKREYYEDFREYYENAKKGIVLNSYGKATLKALEKKGIIRIVKLSNTRGNGSICDLIELINY